MKILKIAFILVIVLLVGVGFAAPIGPLPGFFIGGTPTPSPKEWPDTSTTHEIRLKVPGTLPRVVIVWVVEVDGDLHVVGNKDSGWVSMLGRGGPVEMRLDDATYTLNAVAVSADPQSILVPYVEKYRADYPDIVAGFPTAEEAQGLIAVYRLDRSHNVATPQT